MTSKYFSGDFMKIEDNKDQSSFIQNLREQVGQSKLK